MKSLYLRFFSVLVCASFLFVFGGSCFAPLVYADTIEDMNKTDWAYMYVDSHLGVDVSNIPVTYYGQTLGNYLSTQTENSQTALYNAIQTAGQAVQTGDYATGLQNEVSNAYSYAYSNIYNTVVTDANIAHYTAQKTARTIADGAKTLWDVSGSNFFNSVFNKLFTNGGYKEQYEHVNNGEYNISNENVNVNVTYYGTSQNFPNGYFNNIYENYVSLSGNTRYSNAPILNSNGIGIYKITINDIECYVALSGFGNMDDSFYNNFTVVNSGDNLIFYVYRIEEQNKFLTITLKSTGNLSQNSTPILQPSQLGVIYLNGVKTPVYTDSTKNDFTVNPDGTVTTPNGDILPIYIDPTELSPEGDIILLNYYISLPDVTNNLNIYGQPLPNINLKDNNNQISFTIDGLLDTLVDAILKALEQFFKEPVEDTAEETEEDAQKEYEFIENPFGIISDIWAGFMGVFGFS